MNCPYCIPGQQRCAAHRSNVYQPSKRQRKRDRAILREQRKLNRKPPVASPGPQQQQSVAHQQLPFAQAPFGQAQFGQPPFGLGRGQHQFGGQQPPSTAGQGQQQFGGQHFPFYGQAQSYGQASFNQPPYGSAQGPFYQLPFYQPPFGQAPFGQAPFGQAPFGQAPFGQAPFGQAPFGQAPFGQAQFDQAPPFGQAPFGQAPFGQAPFIQAPFGQAQFGQPPFGSGRGQQQFGGQQPPSTAVQGQQPPSTAGEGQQQSAGQLPSASSQAQGKLDTDNSTKPARTLNPKSLPFSPRKPRGPPVNDTPIKPPVFKKGDNKSGAQPVDSPDWPSQLRSSEPTISPSKFYDAEEDSSSSDELSNDGSVFMFSSQQKHDSDDDSLDEPASGNDSDDDSSIGNESDDDLSSKDGDSQVANGDGEPDVGVDGQQIEYIDLDHYVPSGQALARKKARADKFEIRLQAIRNDATATNTARATFAPVMLDTVSSFTAAAVNNNSEHPDVLGTPLLTGYYPPGIYIHELLGLWPGDGVNSWATDGLIDGSLSIENMLYQDDLTNNDQTVPGGFYMPITTLQQYIPPFHATNEPTWDMYVNRVTTDLVVHNARLAQNEASSAFSLLEIPAEATRVVSVLHFPDHWTTFSIDLQAGRVTFIDSLPNAPRRAFARSVLLQLAQLLEHTMGLSIDEWTFECLAPSRQYNGEDCGFFSIANAANLLRGRAPDQVRFNRASSERYATRCRWSLLRRFNRLLGGTPPVQDPPMPMPGDDVIDDRAPSLEVPSTVPLLISRARSNLQTRMNNYRAHRKKLRAGAKTLDLSGEVSPGSIYPHLVAGYREIIWNTLSSDRYVDGLTIQELTSAVEVSLTTANRDVPDDLVDVLNHLLLDSLHHFTHSGATLRWSLSQLPGRTLNTTYYNLLRSSNSTTPLHGSIDPITSRPMLTIVTIRYSGALKKKHEIELRQRFKRAMDAVDACFNPSPSYSTRQYVLGQPHFPSYVPLLLPNVRGTETLLTMLHSDPTATEALQQLTAQAASQRSKPIYRVVQFGLPGSSVNNDSWEQLVNYYEQLDGELLIGLGPSIRYPKAGLGGFLEESLETSNLLDWFKPFCLLPEDKLPVNHRHVLWGLYKIPALAKRFPLWTGSLQQSPALTNDPRQMVREHLENLACDKLIFLNSLMYYSRVDSRLPRNLEQHQQLIASQLYVGASAGYGGGGRNDMDLGACVPNSEEIIRFCRWCRDDITGYVWGRSLKEAEDEDESLTGFLCDKQECQFMELELIRQLEAEAASTGSSSGGDSPKNKKSKKSKDDDTADSSDDDSSDDDPGDDQGNSYKCKVGYSDMTFADDVMARRRLFDQWMHDDEGNFKILHPSDMTVAQEKMLTKTFSSTTRRKVIYANMRKWAKRHKDEAHPENKSRPITVRCRLSNPYRQAEDLTAGLNSNSTNLGGTPSIESTQLLDEMMHDEQGKFRDPRPLTKEDLARIQKTCNPVSTRSSGEPQYPEMHEVRVMADRRIERHKGKHEREKEDAATNKNKSATKAPSNKKTLSKAKTSTSKASASKNASSSAAKTPSTAKASASAKSVSTTKKTSSAKTSSTKDKSTKDTSTTTKTPRAPSRTATLRSAAPPPSTTPQPPNPLNVAQQRALLELNQARAAGRPARLNTARNKVVYYLCQYTPEHPRSIVAERVLDAVERHVHDDRGRFIFRQYTNDELTRVALNNNGSSSDYATRQMQNWIEAHRGYHERADLEAVRSRVVPQQADGRPTVENNDEDRMEVDEGGKGDQTDV
ncbi:hypothetical protein KCU93_g6555, partial [Aureobasidium melanogenum]